MTGKLTEISSWDEVPEFKDEAEEADYWATHSLSETLLASFQAVPEEGDEDLPPARTYQRAHRASVQLDRDLMVRLKGLARRKGKDYQTLLKEFVVERLYEEERLERARVQHPESL